VRLDARRGVPELQGLADAEALGLDRLALKLGGSHSYHTEDGLDDVPAKRSLATRLIAPGNLKRMPACRKDRLRSRTREQLRHPSHAVPVSFIVQSNSKIPVAVEYFARV